MKRYSLMTGGARVVTTAHADIRNPTPDSIVGQMSLARMSNLDGAVTADAVAVIGVLSIEPVAQLPDILHGAYLAQQAC